MPLYKHLSNLLVAEWMGFPRFTLRHQDQLSLVPPLGLKVELN